MKQSTKSFFLLTSLTLCASSLYAGDLKFSDSVTADQAATLNADLALDWTLPADASMNATLGVSNLSSVY